MKQQINPAEIKLEKVNEEGKRTLWNLLQYSLFEESATDGSRIQPDGTFRYDYFDRYFTDPDREAYLAKTSDSELVGFVMINQYLQKLECGHAIAEFLILPKFRRKVIGREIARRCFLMYPGGWEVQPAYKNERAYQFWKNIIDGVTKNNNQLSDGLFVFRAEEKEI